MAGLPATARRSKLSAVRLFLIGLLPVLVVTCRAQETQADAEPHYTLHAYSNLVDIPTLVLSPNSKPLAAIDEGQFSISLDDGPRFRPTYVRREADDPLRLALLLDLSGSANGLLPALSKSIRTWTTHSLRSTDHVSVYAIDCHVIRTLLDAPADPELLQTAVDHAIHDPGVHGKKTHSACGNSVHLWDAMAFIAQELGQYHGRRVLLTLSDGEDAGSKFEAASVESRAVFKSVTFFNLTPPSPETISLMNAPNEGALQHLCAISGGISIPTRSAGLADDLERVITMLRGRYILEFPRPSNASRGFHRIDVTIDHRDALIRPAGISVPMPDPATGKDPDARCRATTPRTPGSESTSRRAFTLTHPPCPSAPTFPRVASPGAPAPGACPPGLSAAPSLPSR